MIRRWGGVEEICVCVYDCAACVLSVSCLFGMFVLHVHVLRVPDFSPSEHHHLGEELSDVLLYLIRIADRCHVDLPTAGEDDEWSSCHGA